MLRRTFVSLPLAACSVGAAPDESLILLSTAELGRLAASGAQRQVLERLVAKARRAGPWSVTYHRPKNTAAKPNDYYSEGPYWWPDPKNPKGPYIRKDGERNPARFQDNRRDIGEMSEAVLTLALGAALLKDSAAAARARQILSVWFLDPKTRMNPHLEFGQAVIGHNTGRGIGIIDTASLIRCAQGIVLVEAADGLDASPAAGLRRWFADYLRWITTSEKGRDEMNATNNHATWWVAQVAAFATLARDERAKALAWERYRTHLVPGQIEPDGSCPREEARTRSLSYSTMNLDGFAVVCRIAQTNGVDLWRYRSAKAGVEKSFHYLLPYVLNPAAWRKPQITAYDQDQTIYLGLAGVGLKSKELLAAYRKLPRAETPWVLLTDMIVSSR